MMTTFIGASVKKTLSKYPVILLNLNPTPPTFRGLIQIHKDNPLSPVIN